MIQQIQLLLAKDPIAIECFSYYKELPEVNNFLAGNTDDLPKSFNDTIIFNSGYIDPFEFLEFYVKRFRKALGTTPIERILYYWLDYFNLAPIPQFAVGNRRIDLAYPSLKLAVECNGEKFHAGLDNQKKDYIRRIELQNQGWEVIPIWGKDIFSRTLEVVDFIDTLLKERRKRYAES